MVSESGPGPQSWASGFTTLYANHEGKLRLRSITPARGHRAGAQVSVAAAMADWPKRIRDMRYADHEDRGMAD